MRKESCKNQLVTTSKLYVLLMGADLRVVAKEKRKKTLVKATYVPALIYHLMSPCHRHHNCYFLCQGARRGSSPPSAAPTPVLDPLTWAGSVYLTPILDPQPWAVLAYLPPILDPCPRAALAYLPLILRSARWPRWVELLARLHEPKLPLGQTI